VAYGLAANWEFPRYRVSTASLDKLGKSNTISDSDCFLLQAFLQIPLLVFQL
jgi:hypothetical protein